MYVKISYAKQRPFCAREDELKAGGLELEEPQEWPHILER